MKRSNEVLHPQSSKGKFVYEYKTESGDVYLTDEKDNVRYFDTEKEAKEEGGNKPCWGISQIVDPMGD